eukprot:TRINITY_DN35566_c0_g1_i1.p1 TRINITY_DN35566_c0_g1~~TRINITY_DN35566_c0_g1_i1.p1  ORF type:complete len:588 (+),score=75.26 TRINITY_DN35566_c0_g1_i1:79-1764(+)
MATQLKHPSCKYLAKYVGQGGMVVLYTTALNATTQTSSNSTTRTTRLNKMSSAKPSPIEDFPIRYPTLARLLNKKNCNANSSTTTLNSSSRPGSSAGFRASSSPAPETGLHNVLGRVYVFCLDTLQLWEYDREFSKDGDDEPGTFEEDGNEQVDTHTTVSAVERERANSFSIDADPPMGGQQEDSSSNGSSSLHLSGAKHVRGWPASCWSHMSMCMAPKDLPVDVKQQLLNVYLLAMDVNTSTAKVDNSLWTKLLVNGGTVDLSTVYNDIMPYPIFLSVGTTYVSICTYPIYMRHYGKMLKRLQVVKGTPTNMGLKVSIVEAAPEGEPTPRPTEGVPSSSSAGSDETSERTSRSSSTATESRTSTSIAMQLAEYQNGTGTGVRQQRTDTPTGDNGSPSASGVIDQQVIETLREILVANMLKTTTHFQHQMLGFKVTTDLTNGGIIDLLWSSFPKLKKSRPYCTIIGKDPFYFTFPQQPATMPNSNPTPHWWAVWTPFPAQLSFEEPDDEINQFGLIDLPQTPALQNTMDTTATKQPQQTRCLAVRELVVSDFTMQVFRCML